MDSNNSNYREDRRKRDRIYAEILEADPQLADQIEKAKQGLIKDLSVAILGAKRKKIPGAVGKSKAIEIIPGNEAYDFLVLDYLRWGVRMQEIKGDLSYILNVGSFMDIGKYKDLFEKNFGPVMPRIGEIMEKCSAGY